MTSLSRCAASSEGPLRASNQAARASPPGSPVQHRVSDMGTQTTSVMSIESLATTSTHFSLHSCQCTSTHVSMHLNTLPIAHLSMHLNTHFNAPQHTSQCTLVNAPQHTSQKHLTTPRTRHPRRPHARLVIGHWKAPSRVDVWLLVPRRMVPAQEGGDDQRTHAVQAYFGTYHEAYKQHTGTTVI